MKIFKFLVICSLFGSSIFAGRASDARFYIRGAITARDAEQFRAMVNQHHSVVGKVHLISFFRDALATPLLEEMAKQLIPTIFTSEEAAELLALYGGQPSGEAARLAEEERRRQEEAASEALARQLAAGEEERLRQEAAAPLLESLTQVRQGLAMPWDGRSYLSDPLEFQMSLRNREVRIIHNVHNIPSIGKYQDGYPQGTRLALIELDPQMLRNNPTISTALGQKYGTIDAALQKNIKVYVQIRKVPEVAPPFNIILHIWGEAFYDGMFSHNFGVGVFDPNGVVPAGSAVPFNSLGSQNVNRHAGDPGALAQIAYSPNNMQFNFEGSRKLATFWLVAISPDNNHVSVNFIILARDEATYEPLSLANRTSRNLAHLLDKLYSAQVAEDGGALKAAVETIEQLIGVTHATVTRGAAAADPIMLNDPGDLSVK